MSRHSVLRDTIFVGCLFIAFLAVVGVLVASILGESSVVFLTDLFTDPLWLFTITIGLYFSVTGYRRAKSKAV